MNRLVAWTGIFALLSWIGEVIHNALELPQLTLISPENSIPGLISLILFLGWWLLPYKRMFALLLLGWVALHLIGGAVLSVLPLPILPFVPEQSLAHYGAHVIYGLAQLPLILLMLREIWGPKHQTVI